jgi:serine-type D-Ala-D-Ala carboxypeptidase (penicillin-binding protein 5/6)
MSQATLDRPVPIRTRHRGPGILTVVSLLGVGVLGAGLLWWVGWPDHSGTPRGHHRLGSVPLTWPTGGQSAIEVVGAGHRTSGPESPVPIASLAKVMTAYVVLRESSLAAGQAGFTMTMTAADARQALADKASGQSFVPVEPGETLTERQALEALLLPSANNIADVLAAHSPGGETAFVHAMNIEAESLHMTQTRYTDPSGLDPGTTSTALDQLRLARAAMRLPTFAAIVGLRTAVVPIAGSIVNTDSLLGQDGFVGIKTGSTSAAGGCFMFEARQIRAGQPRIVIGAVLGQRGGPLIAAGLFSARDLVRATMAQLGPAQSSTATH